jgi:hypothetical protein
MGPEGTANAQIALDIKCNNNTGNYGRGGEEFKDKKRERRQRRTNRIEAL